MLAEQISQTLTELPVLRSGTMAWAAEPSRHHTADPCLTRSKARYPKASSHSHLPPINMLKTTFTDPEWKQDLQDAGYSDFDTWWNAEGDLVEKGNFWGKDERQSWSHVTRVQMPNGKTIYLKRQQNHYPTNFLNRVRGLLTFQLEWKNYQRLQASGIPTMKVVHFAYRKSKNDKQCLLVTEELEGMISLHELLSHFNIHGYPSREIRLRILSAMLKTVKKLHTAGMLHNALLSRHVFLNIAIVDGKATIPLNLRASLIDLERNKYTGPQSPKLISKDLRLLHKKMPQWPQKDFIWVLKKYLEIDKLTPKAKIIARKLAKQNKVGRHA